MTFKSFLKINIFTFIYLFLSTILNASEYSNYNNQSQSGRCLGPDYINDCAINNLILDFKRDSVAEGNASTNDVVEQKHPSEPTALQDATGCKASLRAKQITAIALPQKQQPKDPPALAVRCHRHEC